MIQNTKASDARDASKALRSETTTLAGMSTQSVGLRLVSSQGQTRKNTADLDARSVMHALSLLTLPATELRVANYLASLSAKHGEAWPRTMQIATALRVDDRAVRRALRALETRGVIASRLLDVGDDLPSGVRVYGAPMRVFRIIPTVARPRTPESDPGRTPETDPGRTKVDRPLNDLNDPGSFKFHDDNNDHDQLTSVARGPSQGLRPPLPKPPEEREREKDDRSSDISTSSCNFDRARAQTPTGSSDAPPEGDAPLFGSCDEPPSSEVAIVDEREREAFKESDSRARRSAAPREYVSPARILIARWVELVASLPKLEIDLDGEPRFFKSRVQCIKARLADGFRIEELADAIERASRSSWYNTHPHRFQVPFVLRSADAVTALLSDPRLRRRQGGAKRVLGGGVRARIEATGQTSTERISRSADQTVGTGEVTAFIASLGTSIGGGVS